MSNATNVVQNANINKDLEISSTMVLKTVPNTCGYVCKLGLLPSAHADR